MEEYAHSALSPLTVQTVQNDLSWLEEVKPKEAKPKKKKSKSKKQQDKTQITSDTKTSSPASTRAEIAVEATTAENDQDSESGVDATPTAPVEGVEEPTVADERGSATLPTSTQRHTYDVELGTLQELFPAWSHDGMLCSHITDTISRLIRLHRSE